MNGSKIVILAAALAVLPLSMASAGGAGGLTWGQQYFDSQLSNFDVQSTYSGAYGYGVTRHGQRIGGFALAVRSSSPDSLFEGGFAGLITGQEVRAGPFLMAVNLWTGLGALRTGPALPTGGSLALFGELDLELGLGFISWMEVTGCAGMQAVTRIAGGRPLFSNVMYTPVLGARVAWGSFSRIQGAEYRSGRLERTPSAVGVQYSVGSQ
jgi:hypothetical protein